MGVSTRTAVRTLEAGVRTVVRTLEAGVRTAGQLDRSNTGLA